MADRMGQQLGNYRVIRQIGHGGFAEVYLGEHIYLKTQVAIKLLQSKLGTEEDLESFLKEARTVAHLIHPNIIRVIDFGVDDQTPFLVMDYALNGTLRQRHPKGTRLSLTTIITYVKQVAAALQYAHNEKLIHRDVKPENMLLGRTNDVLLSDFGIALIAQSSRYQSTQEVIGTVAYMSPEQIQGKPRPASDQYSLGIVAYEWLSGDRPFHGSFTELCTQHMFAVPPPLHEKVPDILPDVEKTIMTALAKDPHQRFGSVQAFANALEQASQGGPPAVLISPPASQPRSSLPPAILVPPPKKVSPKLGTILATYHGHSEGVNAVAWSPDGKYLASASSDRTSRVWDVARGKEVCIYRGHSKDVKNVAWLSTGRHIATGSDDKTVQVWDATNGNLIHIYQYASRKMKPIAWLPDVERIAWLIGDKTIEILDPNARKSICTYQGHKDGVLAVAWSSNSTWIASAGHDPTVQIWDANTGKNISTYHGHSQSAAVTALVWSPDGQHIASADQGGAVHIWDATTTKRSYLYRGNSNWAYAIAWSPDGTRIASGSFGSTVQVWQAT